MHRCGCWVWASQIEQLEEGATKREATAKRCCHIWGAAGHGSPACCQAFAKRSGLRAATPSGRSEALRAGGVSDSKDGLASYQLHACCQCRATITSIPHTKAGFRISLISGHPPSSPSRRAGRCQAPHASAGTNQPAGQFHAAFGEGWSGAWTATGRRGRNQCSSSSAPSGPRILRSSTPAPIHSSSRSQQRSQSQNPVSACMQGRPRLSPGPCPAPASRQTAGSALQRGLFGAGRGEAVEAHRSRTFATAAAAAARVQRLRPTLGSHTREVGAPGMAHRNART